MSKWLIKGFLLLLLLAAGLYLWRQGEEKDRIEGRIASQDWTSLVSANDKLAGELELPDLPPTKTNSFLVDQPATIDVEYHNGIFFDASATRSEAPYLGHLLRLTTMVPLQRFSGQDGLGFQRVFKTTLANNEIYFVCVFSDGHQINHTVLYSDGGEVIDVLSGNHLGIQQHENYLIVQNQEQFQLIQITPSGFELQTKVDTAPFAAYLQRKAVGSKPSEIFHCLDFQSQVRGKRVTVWAFNVSTTGFLPRFLHLQFSFRLSGGNIDVGETFGVATRADRLPIHSRKMITARVDERFWVPRANDAQIDIFNLKGQLEKTVPLAPLPSGIATGGNLTSKEIQMAARAEADPTIFHGHYNQLNFISAVFPLDDYILVSRINYQNPRYQVIYTLLNKNGDILTEDFFANDFSLLGFRNPEVFSLRSFGEEAIHYPPWLRAFEKFDREKLTHHSGWWLLGFQVRRRVGYNEPVIESASTGDPVKTKITDGSISAKLATNLDKAKQLRQLLKFEGFVKLKTPDQHALKELTDAIYVGGTYFVIDRPGNQFLHFDADGTFLKAVGRPGQGPGEFQSPRVLARAYEGHFAMVDRNAIHLYRQDGSFIHKIEGMRELGLAVGGNLIVWDEPDRFYLNDPFPSAPDQKQFALVTITEQGPVIKGFGKRFALWERMFADHQGYLHFNSFTRAGDRIWVGSPYNASVELFDLEGNPIGELKDSYHPKSVTYADFEGLNPRTKGLFQNFYFQKVSNKALHPLGPLVIRSLVDPGRGYMYDAFDWEGNLLAKGLRSGASTIEILDTYENVIIGKMIGLEQAEPTEEDLKRRLYRPEYEGILAAGFRFGVAEDYFYLWVSRLAE